MNKTRNIIAGISLLSLICFLIYTIVIINKPIEKTIQGTVEAKQIKVSSKLIGRIESLPISKGEDVKAGQLLFTIESPEVHAKLNQAKAGKLAAEAQSTKAQNGARNEDIQAAYNMYQKALAAEGFMIKTHTRINNLQKDGIVPTQKLDEITAKRKAAEKTTLAAKMLWEKAKNGARVEDKTSAQALVKRAEGVIEEINSYLNETRITAPINGEIANIIAEEGELIPAGYPVVSIVDLNDIWITFHLKETLLSNVKKGSIINAKIPALANKEIKLKITYIHPLGDYATWNATKATGEFDIKTFEIHAKPVKTNQGLRSGMSAIINNKEFNL
ncbi:MAG: efflux RND transporter periplasmic adaptor subunit [Bacteroidota bacterium]|nr:efflux RND transporter periplasmic adaptor subunit [Bacteroidota bacterium]